MTEQWTTVAFASVEEDDDAFVVAFEETEDHGHALFLMSDLEEPGDQEIKLGMDTYCLVNEHDVTFYGGIERAALEESVLELSLSQDAATALSLPRELTLRLDLDEETVDAVRDGLRWVLTFGNPMHHPALVLGEPEPDEPEPEEP